MLCDQLERDQARGLVLDDADDDLAVFVQLMEVGISRLRLTEFRFLGDWEFQFNQLRSFRPPRMTNAAVEGISQPFDPDKFNFNRAYLKKEILWSGSLAGRFCSLFYNKFPFVDLHGLLVPESRQGYPQLLSEEFNSYLWDVTAQLAETLPGVGFGYNSYGANASVNHLHFQMFLRDRPLPVADAKWIHNGGNKLFPATCFRFDSPASSWRFIAELHRRKISYNLIYLPGCLYCLPRQKQGHYEHAPWSTGFAWYEMAGGYTTFSEQDFMQIGGADITEELKKVTLDPVTASRI